MDSSRDWEQWDKVANPLDSFWSKDGIEIRYRQGLAGAVAAVLGEGEKFLEIGCGGGLVYKELVPAFLPSERYTGIDNSPAMLKLARERFPSGDFRDMDGFMLEFPAKSFGVAGAFSLFSHLPEFKTVLAEMWRVASRAVLFTIFPAEKTVQEKEGWGGASFLKIQYSSKDVLESIREVCGQEVYTLEAQAYPVQKLYTVFKIKPPKAPVHSVILGSYNRPKLVRRAIRSVFAQTFPDWQLIVADDGSDAKTLQAIQEEIKDDSRAFLNPCREPISDVYRTDCSSRACRRINDALKLVRGQMIHYLADDDWYVPARFDVFNRLFGNPKVMCGYGRLMIVDGNGNSAGQLYPPSPCHQPLYHLDHNQVAHRTETLATVGDWPTKEIGDYALEGHFFNILAKHWPFVGRDEVVAYKVFHPLNMQKTREHSTKERE